MTVYLVHKRHWIVGRKEPINAYMTIGSLKNETHVPLNVFPPSMLSKETN